VMKVGKVEENFVDPHVVAQTTWEQDPRLIRAQEARRRWDFATAKRELEALLREQPDHLDARRAAMDIGFETEEWSLFAANATKLLETYIAKKEHELAIDLIRELTDRADPKLPDRFFIRAAQYVERCEERQWAIALLRTAARIDKNGANGLRALVKAAQITRQLGNEGGARDLLNEARFHPACAGELEQLVSNQIAAMDRPAVIPPRVAPRSQV
jgi:hypothetical protein